MQFLYFLLEPADHSIRYVGITNKLGWRFYGHTYYSVKLHKHHTACWLRKLDQQGLKPLMQLVDLFDTREEACAGEIQWIARLRSEGADLTNFSDGGDLGVLGKSWTLSAEARSNISAGKKRYFAELRAQGIPIRSPRKGAKLSAETKRKIGEAKRGKPGTPHTEEFKAKVAEMNRKRVWSDESRKKVGDARREAARRRREGDAKYASEDS